MAESERLLVRATMHLRGLRPGDRTYVDPRDPYVRLCLRSKALVPVTADEKPAD